MLRPLIIGLGAFLLVFLPLLLVFPPDLDLPDQGAPWHWWGALVAGGLTAGLASGASAAMKAVPMGRIALTAAVLALCAAALLLAAAYSTILIMQVVVLGIAVLGDILTAGRLALADQLQQDLAMPIPLSWSDLAMAVAVCWIAVMVGRALSRWKKTA